MDISEYKLELLPPSFYYIPNYINEDKEAYLIKKIIDSPKVKWTQLLNRRLQNWGGLPHIKGMVQEVIPEWLSYECKSVSNLGIFGPNIANHVLINEYLPGQGIMPHTDGTLYFPTVCTINLGSSCRLDFYKSINESNLNDESIMQGNEKMDSTLLKDRFISSVYLERRSLVVFKDDIYSFYLHGIKETQSDIIDATISNFNYCNKLHFNEIIPRLTRYSMTIRYVPKVLKSISLFGKQKMDL